MNAKLILLISIIPILADGDIVFTPFSGDLTPENRNEYILDINDDESPDFRVYAEQILQMRSVKITPLNSNEILFDNEFLPDVYAATASDTISQDDPIGTTSWHSREGVLSWSDIVFPEGLLVSGQFLETNAYVGVCFKIDSNTHYGWIGIDNPTSQPGGTITGFAYETNPNTGIIAGAIPEPGTVALFSIGSIGLYLVRKKKNNRTNHSTLR